MISNTIYITVIKLADLTSKNAKDLKPILPALAERYKSSIDTNSIMGGRWDGNVSNIGLFSGGNKRWQPLSKSYIKQLTKSSKKGKLRNLTRTLNRSGGAGLQGTIEINPLNQYQIKFGIGGGSPNPRKYAAIHNFGGTINISARSRITRLRKTKGKYQFAKAKHKKAIEKKTSSKAYQIKIPPSPYMVLQTSDIEFTYKLISEYLQRRIKVIDFKRITISLINARS